MAWSFASVLRRKFFSSICTIHRRPIKVRGRHLYLENLEDRTLLSGWADIAAAYNRGLDQLVGWAATLSSAQSILHAFPIVAGSVANALHDSVQQGLDKPVHDYFTSTSQPSAAGLADALKHVSAIDPQSVRYTDQGNVSEFNLTLQASASTSGSLDNLTIAGAKQNLRPDGSAQFNLASTFTLAITFGVDASSMSQPPVFYLKTPTTLQATASVQASNLNFGLRVGLLGASVQNGSVQLTAQPGITLQSSHSDGRVTLDDLGGPVDNLIQVGARGNLNVSLPIQATLGGVTTNGTVLVQAGDLAQPDDAVIQFVNFDGWKNLANLGPADLPGLVDQLAGQLGQLGSHVIASALPLAADKTLGQIADLATAFRTQVVNQLTHRDSQNRQILNFATAQELATLLANIPGVSNVGIQFNPATNDLTYHLHVTYTFGRSDAGIRLDLNQGGLSAGQLGDGNNAPQLSLTPSVTADLTFGVNLSPVGNGFVLTPATTLASLNGGAGVRVNATGSDLQVTLSNNASFQVSLAGSRTIQDVITAIQNASGGRVQVSIDPDSRVGLLVKQVTAPRDSDPAKFAVAAINNSYAAADLGIQGVDVAGTGTITGLALHGDSLEKHFFIQNPSFQAIVDAAANQIGGSANLGIVALLINSGSATAHAQAALTLQDPNTGTAGHITLRTLADAARDPSLRTRLVASSSFAGSAHVDLPVQLKVPLPGVNLQTGTKIVVDWPDVTDASKLSVSVQPKIDVLNLAVDQVIRGLEGARDFLLQQQNSRLFQYKIPVLDHSLADLINPAGKLDAVIRNLRSDPPTTIDQLVSRLSTALGQAVLPSLTNNVFQLNLAYGFQNHQAISLGFDLGSRLGRFADFNGSSPLDVQVNGSVNLGLVIDISQPTSPRFYLQDRSQLTVGVMVNGSNIHFDASVGPLGLFVRNGSIRLDNGTPGQPATFSVTLNTNSPDHRWLITDVPAHLTAGLTGQISAVLPVFFPFEDQPLDPNKPNIELHIADLNHPDQITTVLPDFQKALDSLNLDSVFNSVAEGWSGVLRLLEAVLTSKISVQKIPLVGNQLQHALDFLHQMNDRVLAEMGKLPQLAAKTVQKALYDGLGPQGLNWLEDSAGNPATKVDDVNLTQTADGGYHYHLKLGSRLFQVNAPIGVNLGLDGLGLKIDGNVQLKAGFNIDLGFGVNKQDGFYLDAGDRADVTFTAGLPVHAVGKLGFLQLDVTSGTDPQFQGSMSVALKNPHNNGKVQLADLTSSSTFDASLNARADVTVHLQASFGGNTDLPHVDTDFQFHWSLGGSVTVGFTNVTLDLGGFIDGIVHKIGAVLQPIKPAVDILTTRIPVISDLIGHNYTLLDMATDLGYVGSGTRDFINAVAQFVRGSGLGVSRINLGSFDLDAGAAQDASAQGHLALLDPATQDTTVIDPNSTSNWTGTTVTGFDIPILKHPALAFHLLLGEDVPLVTYGMPTLDVKFSFSQFFPIIGPLGARLSGAIGAQAHFGFGFDTFGLRQFVSGGFRDPSLILNGLYVSDRANADGTGPATPQVRLYGSIEAYASLNLLIAEAGIGGGVFATIDFSLHDPSQTGKVHLPDLLADIKKGTLFDAVGSLKAFLDAYVEINLLFFHKRWTFTIAEVTLGTIDQHAPPASEQVPQLGTVQGGVLRLNVGPYSAQRLYGDLSDGNQPLRITPGSLPDSVIVHGFGQDQTYNGVTKIVADGVKGNVTVDVGNQIDVDLAAGSDNNTFVVTRARNVTLTGGAGNDSLEVDTASSAVLNGGSGTEVLRVTGSGSATLQAGDGNDTLYAGSGDDQQLFGGNGNSVLCAGSGKRQILHGGHGHSTLIGGSGDGQQLYGDDSTAVLFGGTGRNQLVNGGSGNDSLYAGEADGQTLIGGSGNDVLMVGWHFNAGALTDWGTPVPGDSSRGTGHGYEMHAGSGNTLVIGGRGKDTIYGGAGNDTLYGGGGPGDKLLYAGSGNSVLYGGYLDSTDPRDRSTGNATLYGGLGNDTLYGGDGRDADGSPGLRRDSRTNELISAAGDGTAIGNDLLVAGPGNTVIYADTTGHNTLIGGPGRDTLYAGIGGDYLVAGTGVNALFGGPGDDIFQLSFNVNGQPNTPITLVGGPGLNTLLLKPVQVYTHDNELDETILTTNSDIYLTLVTGTTNQYLATLRNLGATQIVGQVKFTLPEDVERVALLGGYGDNKIQLDPSIQRGIFLYGGTGHNTLLAGSGNDTLVGGPGSSTLYGGKGNDVLYGGPLPAQYRQMWVSFANSIPPTTQAPGPNVLIAGTGNSQLYAGDGGDLLIGGSAHWDGTQWKLDPGAGRDFLVGGKGDDLLVAGLGSLGAAMFAGTGNDVLVGGDGENILQGSSTGTALMLGGGLINIMLSNSPRAGGNTLVGGAGLNFEFAGAGTDALYDYSDQASWTRAQAVATRFHIVLPAPTTNGANYIQESDTLLHQREADYPEWKSLDTTALYPDETGTTTSGSDHLTGLAFNRQAGNTISGTNTITGLDTRPLIEGQLVSGPGIPAGTTILRIDATRSSITISNNATATAAGVQLSFSNLLLVGMTVSGPGIPDGTTVIAMDSAASITLSKAATASANGAPLKFGLNPEQAKRLEQLNDEFARMDLADLNIHTKGSGAQRVILDYLQGGAGNNRLYAGPNPVWIVGGTSGNHTIYITPANYDSFPIDTIFGGIDRSNPDPKETLMFQADGDIHLSYDRITDTDTVTINNGQNRRTLQWKEGSNINVVGVQTLGGNDTVTIDSAFFGSATNTIRVEDGGDAMHRGNVIIDASISQSHLVLLGGVGNDIIKIGTKLASNPVVQSGSGRSELDILGGNEDVYVREGPWGIAQQETLLINSIPVDGSSFQKVMVVGGGAINNFTTDGKIPNVVLVGGRGPNTMSASGGTSTLIGGTGFNTFILNGPGNYTVVGGAGTNALTIQCDDRGDTVRLVQNGATVTLSGTLTATATYLTTVTVLGGRGNNTLDASQTTVPVSLRGGGGSDTLYGGAGVDTLDGGAGTVTLIGGSGNTRFYVSGNNSIYRGGSGANRLVYRARDGDQVIAYSNGLLINGGIVENGDYRTLTGQFIAFGAISGIGTIEVEDGGGSATIRSATLNDIPATKSWHGSWSNQGYGVLTHYDFSIYGCGVHTEDHLIVGPPNSPKSYISATYVQWWWQTSGGDASVSDTYWTWNSAHGVWNGVNLHVVTPNMGVILFGQCIPGVTHVWGDLLGYTYVWQDHTDYTWNYDSRYGFWNGNSVVGPGLNLPVPELDVAATDANGAVVKYPTAKAGGQNPTATVTYSVPDGSRLPIGTTTVTATTRDANGNTTSQNFRVVVFAALAVTGSASITAGVPDNVTVTAKDVFGNTLTGYRGKVHFISTDPAAVLPPDYTFTAADNGVHTFPVTWKTAGNRTLSVAQVDYCLMPAQIAVTVLPAAADHYQVGGPNEGIFVNAGTPLTFTVTARDPYGNVTPGYHGTVHFTSSDPQAALPADYTFTAADNGVHTFTNVILKTAGTRTVTATDTANGTIKGTSVGISVFHVRATTFVVSGFPTPITAGTAGTFTVTAKDPYGNVDTSYVGTVHFTSSDPQAILPSVGQFLEYSYGVRTFSATLKTAGTQSITATDGTRQGTQAGITVIPAVASSLLLSGFPTSITAGQSGNLTVTLKDAFGNVATGYRGTVHFTSTDGQAVLPANYTFIATDNGLHTFSVTLKTAGTQTITVADTVTGGLKATQPGITVVPAAPSMFIVAGFPTPVVAGTPGTFTVTGKDVYGNTTTNYTGLVHFSSTDPQASLPADARLTNGTGLFSATLKTVGTQSITATDTVNSAITGRQTGITVNPAAASSLLVSGFPTSIAAGQSGDLSVTLKDAFGNVATGYRGTVHFTSTDGQATLPANYTFTAADSGTHTFSVTLKTAGSQSVTATDTAAGSIHGQATVLVTAAAPATFQLGGPVNPVNAGAAFDLTLTVVDAYGNVATGYTGTVQFASSDAQATVLADYTFTAADGGTHLFAGGVTLRTAIRQTVTATDSVNASLTGSVPVTVQPGPAQALRLDDLPATIQAGVLFSATITALDQFGNVATGYLGTLAFDGGDDAVVPADYTFTAADAGTHTFSGLMFRFAADSRALMVSDGAAGFSALGNITVTPAAADHFLVTTSADGSSTVAGTPFDVTVTVQDAYGNTVSDYTRTITFSSADPYGAALPADYTFQPTDMGTVTFAGGATLYTAGTWDVTVTDTASGITGATMVAVTPTAADHFRIDTPATVAPNTPFDVTVTALDPYGNVDVNYQGTVTFSTTDLDPAVMLPADYTFDATDNGIHTFAAVSLVTPGDQVLTVADLANSLSTDAIVTVTDSGSPDVRGAGERSSREVSGAALAQSEVAAAAAATLSQAVARLAGESGAGDRPPAGIGSPSGISHRRHALDSFFAETVDQDWDGSFLAGL
jgi:Ca2+-binding RTX toxin-like protein